MIVFSWIFGFLLYFTSLSTKFINFISQYTASITNREVLVDSSWWNLCSAFLADIFILDCDYNVCINGYKNSFSWNRVTEKFKKF